MTIGHCFIGKEIKGKIYYSDYNWLFLIDLLSEKNIKYWARKLNKQWFNKKSMANKGWGWKIAKTRKDYKEDIADYHLLIKGDKILNSARGSRFKEVKRKRK